MITIGKIPKKLQSFFKPVKKPVFRHVYSYFWSMVLSICISHGSTIDKLVKLLRNRLIAPITANSCGEAPGTNR